MKKQRVMGRAKLALAGCLLAAACNQARTSPALICDSTQILGTDQRGQLVCVTAPQGSVNTPSCATGLTSDGQQLLCTTANTTPDKDQGANAALQQLGTALDSAQRQLQPGVPMTRYVGLSSVTSSADLFAYAKEGMAASVDICSADFGSGAHMCVMDELYQAVVNGTLGAADTIAQAWVYMPNWNTPLANSENPFAGLADNCSGYAEGLNSHFWLGITVEWGPLPDGTPGFRWHGGTDERCSNPHRIACCK